MVCASSGITATVVGVIMNLAVWFSLHTVFSNINAMNKFGMRLLIPELKPLDLISLLIAICAFVAIFRYKLSMLTTLAGSVVVGLDYHLLFRS